MSYQPTEWQKIAERRLEEITRLQEAYLALSNHVVIGIKLMKELEDEKNKYKDLWEHWKRAKPKLLTEQIRGMINRE
jgi:hypothetical protein